MKKIVCMVLILSFLTMFVFAEETEKPDPVKIEWNDKTPQDKGALIVWTALTFTITAIVTQEVMMGTYR